MSDFVSDVSGSDAWKTYLERSFQILHYGQYVIGPMNLDILAIWLLPYTLPGVGIEPVSTTLRVAMLGLARHE